MTGLVAFIEALPELIALFKLIQTKDDKKKTKQDLKKIKKAIEDKDEKALNDVFNSL